jgi:hypothetical protein
MSIYDDYFNPSTMFGGGDARGDADKGYNQARAGMDPYAQGGMNDWNQYHQWMQQQGNTLNQYGNPADWQWKHANMSPDDFYNQMMGGYQQSPQAKYAMNQMTNATDHAASASGMLGSGAYGKALNQNANQISQNDMQQYWNNVMGAMNKQSGFINNFQGQQNNWQNAMRWGANTGFNAASNEGNWAVGEGNANAADDWKRQQGMEQMIGMAARGMGGGGM